MNRLSAHIGYLYADLPLAERLAAAAHDGFTAVEHPGPYDIPAPQMRQRLNDLGLTFAQITSGMGGPGEKGLACLPGRETEFRAGFQRALDYAQQIGCPFVHPMAGVVQGSWLDAAGTYQANLGWALEQADAAGMRVLIEAITIPGYFMGTLEAAAKTQDAFAGRPALLIDSYHAAVLDTDPAQWIAANAARIGHVHMADHPGRHEPGTGRIDFAAMLSALQAAGYGGAIGFEYIPSITTTESTRFLAGWKRLLPDASGMNQGA
ncbi:hydroxypyruvate isomerase family protein [Paracoccus laeviglucosivorans]|uniref:Hydroxypyruvate isomerase n=1 Tax=Paracoccus laeviglucosivorans TaxID=1197861 RepID=A0A521FAG7_9RHOB|nr:TIM barrel protein [Paracoccus laeviglucosivorans]SMO93155.1 hydroxypyruvate isomerase [Paracoccus laeviglucosivorans]